MKRIMLTAMNSNAGKTVMTCALLAALKRRGLDVRSFKCGPDYIDPMFHSRVLGIPCLNLDLFLQGEEGVKRTLKKGGELAVMEGAMGYYDGTNGTSSDSAWEIASKTGTPAILVIRPKGVGVSLAAQIRGMMSFRPDSGIRGILLADCSAAAASYMTPVLQRETGLPVLGYLPPMKEAELGSRHLGLMTAAEIRDLTERIEALADQAEKTIDIDGILELAGKTGDAGCFHEPDNNTAAGRTACRIVVAKDEAFCFYYEDSFDALRRSGAELVFFSPLKDQRMPEDADGLYLGGGYPELYVETLSENTGMLTGIRKKIRDGLPVLAECGGFLYLQQTLEDDSAGSWPVCGVLPGNGFQTKRLQRFGYQWLEADEDSMLFRKGERVPAHEFHYWDCTENGGDLTSVKPDGRRWRCGFASGQIYAAFPHLHLGGKLPLAERFTAACAAYRMKRDPFAE